MKLPKIESKNDIIEYKLGGHFIPFRRLKITDFLILDSHPLIVNHKGDTQKIMLIMIALLIKTEDTLEEKIEWLQNVELEDITELTALSQALGLNQKKISELSSETKP